MKAQYPARTLVLGAALLLFAGFLGMRIGEVVATRKAMTLAGSRPGGPGRGQPSVGQGGWNQGGGRVETVSVQVEPVSRGSVEEEVVLAGSLEPQYQVDVFSKRAGRVSRLAVSVGQRVKRGDLLATVEHSDLLLQQEQAAASLAASKAAYRKTEAQRDKAAADYERVKLLYEQRASTQQELQNAAGQLREAEIQLEVAKAQLQQAEANAALVKLQLEQVNTDAPVPGVVIRAPGVAGSQVTTSTPVAVIAAIDPIEVAFSVPERDLGRLRAGQEFTITVDAFPNESFRGKITSLGAVVEASTRTLPVRGRVANPDLRLRPGMFARVALVVGRKENVVTVPREALMTRPEGLYVFVVADGIAQVRPITVGVRGKERVEVPDGVKEGETVAVVGQQQLRDGQEVRAVLGGSRPASRRGGNGR